MYNSQRARACYSSGIARDSSVRNHRSPLSRDDAGHASGTSLAATACSAAAENRISLAASARITRIARERFVRSRAIWVLSGVDSLSVVSMRSDAFLPLPLHPSASSRRSSVRKERFQQLFLFFSRATSPTSIRRADKIDFSLAKRRRRRLQRRRQRRKRRMEYLRAPPRHFRFLRQSFSLSVPFFLVWNKVTARLKTATRHFMPRASVFNHEKTETLFWRGSIFCIYLRIFSFSLSLSLSTSFPS